MMVTATRKSRMEMAVVIPTVKEPNILNRDIKPVLTLSLLCAAIT